MANPSAKPAPLCCHKLPTGFCPETAVYQMGVNRPFQGSALYFCEAHLPDIMRRLIADGKARVRDVDHLV